MKVELDFSNYAAKADLFLKKGTGADTSDIDKKRI